MTSKLNKFCSSCGAELKSEDAVICVACGAGQQKQAKEWTSGTKGGLYLLAIFIPLVGGIAGIIGLFNENNRATGIGLLVLSFFCWMFWTFVLLGLMVV